ncbi:MAG: hypothetical protein A3B10_04560 [Candidatus Doudnabacteria bacterium RIFCSPLOWO2_01_FULL_44_21]|uniref:Uncharacterized protein n=2 Tax=Bacteria candidate phyla TaxID=1783234 RepID=A0A1G2QZ58_9BACT|nr:MAG: hypothetical protein A3B10_04560 [Candidatus Doudnabacteria bacterium RIFCSPLOWO2_01_FULL_44_21]OHA65101.1 MAG: hypothetical protein A2672_01375 [Candidatus Wildermuthbacteria bacterium RIFCSPHIGHO2_01_FULL_49_22b]
MDPIVIEKKEELDKGWRFIVEVGTHEETQVGFAVTIDKDYWQELTLGKFPPERLLRESLRFLLLKQSRNAIVRDLGNDFSLRNIQTLFYSYERRMKMALFGTEYPKKQE